MRGMYQLHLTPSRRDVKPENIVLEDSQPGGRVYLVDFGGVQVSAQLRISRADHGLQTI